MSTEVSGDGLLFRMLLGELAESLSIPKLEPGADGSCHVVFDGKVAVELRQEAGWLVLFATLGRIDEESGPISMPRLLEANLFWQGTAGATIGMSRAGLVVMAHRLPLAGFSLPALRDALEQFINTAEHWQATVSQPADLTGAHDMLASATAEFVRV